MQTAAYNSERIPKEPPTVRLLVVEDSAAYVYLIQRAFHMSDDIRWEVTVAEDGERAVHFLFGYGKETAPLPDLILLAHPGF
jgi:CheY-like chemotaxis protein